MLIGIANAVSRRAWPISRKGGSAELIALRAAMETCTHYAVTGDSTRDHSSITPDAVSYMSRMLGKAGIEVIDNAQSGRSGEEWSDGNISPGGVSPNVDDLIAVIPGTGSTTVVEFSHGINDTADGSETVSEQLAKVTPGLDALLSAKPDVTIFFVQPVRVGVLARNTSMNAWYAQMAADYGAYLCPLFKYMDAVYDNGSGNVFYADSTHPSAVGMIRLVNFILSQILPASLLGTVMMDNKHWTGAEQETILSSFDDADIRTGEYWNSGGTISASAAWACFPIMDVGYGERVKLFHNGDRDDIRVTKDGVGSDNTGATLLETRATPDSGALPGVYSYDITNVGVKRVGATIRSDSSAIVGDEYMQRIFFQNAKSGGDLEQIEINAGFGVRMSQDPNS